MLRQGLFYKLWWRLSHVVPYSKPLLEDRGSHFLETALKFRVVGQGPDDGNLGGAAGLDAFRHQPAGVDQQAGAGALLQAVLFQVADLLAQFGQRVRVFLGATALTLDDLSLDIGGGVVELDGDEPLAGAVLQVFKRALVTGVVRNAEQEPVVGLDDGAGLFDR